MSNSETTRLIWRKKVRSATSSGHSRAVLDFEEFQDAMKLVKPSVAEGRVNVLGTILYRYPRGKSDQEGVRRLTPEPCVDKPVLQIVERGTRATNRRANCGGACSTNFGGYWRRDPHVHAIQALQVQVCAISDEIQEKYSDIYSGEEECLSKKHEL